MRVLVTGGSGFLGRFVIRRLVETSVDVVALARSREARRAVAAIHATPVDGDLDDSPSVLAAFTASGAERLINLASLGFGHAPTIVAAAEAAGFERSVFVSTTAIFTTLPAASRQTKVAAEDTIRSSGLNWAIARPTMIYGAPGDRNLERLLRHLRRLPVVPAPGGGRGLQQPVHVEDVAAAVIALCDDDGAAGAELNIAGPDPLSLREVIHHAGAAVGRTARVVPVPLGPTMAMLRAYGRICSRPRLRAEQAARLAEDKVVDIAPARRLIGFDPRAFPVGIGEEARALGLAPRTDQRR
jgi:nucleoside-diphosphate-sugar epimerase